MKLVADANVLLAAVIGGRARLILAHPQILEVLTTARTLAEVAVAALPVTVVDGAAYAKKLPEAIRRIGRRDPDDAELLALALQRRIPLWSNDRDFETVGVELFTTEGLLRHLGIVR